MDDHDAECNLLFLPNEMLVEVLKNMSHSSIAAVRLTCKQLYSVTKALHLWLHLAEILQTEPGCSKLDSSRSYNQRELEEWVRRRHHVKEHWAQTSAEKIFRPRSCNIPAMRIVALPGERFCLVFTSGAPYGAFMGDVLIVDLESKTPKTQRLFETPDNGSWGRFAVGSCLDSQSPLTYTVAIAWSSYYYPVNSTFVIYTIKLIGDPANPSFSQTQTEVLTPTYGGHHIIPTKQYVLLLHHNKIVINPRINGLYSNKWIGATIKLPSSIASASILPGNRLLIFLHGIFHIYDLSQMLRWPFCNSSTNLPLLAYSQSIVYCSSSHYSPSSPLFHYSPSLPFIDAFSTRFVVDGRTGLHGLEIPHDPTKLPKTFQLTEFKRIAMGNIERPLYKKWCGNGVARSFIMFNDGRLEIITHEWGIGLETSVSIQHSYLALPELRNFNWKSIGIFFEDIGRIVLQDSDNITGEAHGNCWIVDVDGMLYLDLPEIS